MDVIFKISSLSLFTDTNKSQACLGAVGFRAMPIPDYSLIVAPLYQVTQKRNNFQWGLEQQ